MFFNISANVQSIPKNDEIYNLSNKNSHSYYINTVKVLQNEKKVNTHKHIVKVAIDTLYKDIENSRIDEINTLNKKKIVYNFFEKHYSKIIEGSIEPDITENDPHYKVPTFEGHFYDPDTGLNFCGNRFPTAYTRFVEHSIKAKELYEQNNIEFAKELGKALHYLGDAGEPHHSSNKIAFLTNHIKYESYAKLLKNTTKIKEGSLYYSFEPKNLSDTYNFSEYCKKILSYTAHFSKSYTKSVDINFEYREKNIKNDFAVIEIKTMSNKDFKDLNKSINENIENCENISAAYLLNFLKSVNLVNVQS